MISIIVSVMIVLVLVVDFVYFGYLFGIIGFLPKFNGYRYSEKILIQERMVSGYSDAKYYIGMTYLILTNQRLLFRPQLYTCVLSLDLDKIEKVEEIKKNFIKYICVWYKKDGINNTFYFHPKQYNLWLAQLMGSGTL